MADPFKIMEREGLHSEHAALCYVEAKRRTKSKLVKKPGDFICEDHDSPWLICKPCAADGKCARAADRAAHESLAALASQPAARVALTWDQFVAACEAEYGEDFAPEEFVDVPEDQKEELMRVVRMVERAHGIDASGGEVRNGQ